MKIEINIEKKHFYFLVALVCVLFVIGVNAYVNPTTGVGHDASETGPGTFGGPGDYVFPNVVFWNGALTNSRGYLSAWPSGGVNRIAIGSENPSVPQIDFWNTGGAYSMNITAGSVMLRGNIGTNGYDPNTNSKGWDWGMGVHTWDVFAEASIWANGGIGTGGNLHSDGALFVGQNADINGELNVTGKIRSITHSNYYSGIPLSTLKAYQPSCTGGFGGYCVSACNRFCLARKYSAGVIVEWDGSSASCGCIP